MIEVASGEPRKALCTAETDIRLFNEEVLLLSHSFPLKFTENELLPVQTTMDAVDLGSALIRTFISIVLGYSRHEVNVALKKRSKIKIIFKM